MTDRQPFSDPDPEAHLFDQVMSRTRPTPASKGKDVGPFEPVIAKALSLSPRERWRTARELLAALDQISQISQAAQTPDIPASPLPAFAQERSRGPAKVGVAVAAVALVVGLGWRHHTASQLPEHAHRQESGASSAPVPPVPARVVSPASTVSVVPSLSLPSRPAAESHAPKKAPAGVRRNKRDLRAPAGDDRDLFDDTK